MTTAEGEPSLSPKARWRGILVAMLLFVEATLLTNRFDVGGLPEIDATWAGILRATRILLPCGIAVGAGLALFGRDLLRRAIRARGDSLPRSWPAIVATHGLALVGFWLATSRLFVALPSEPASRAGLGAAWCFCGAVTLGSAMLLVLPFRTWRWLNREGAGTCAGGLAVGVVAWTAGQQGEAAFWHPLSEPTLAAVRALLTLVTPDALPADGLIAGTARFQVSIGVGCSGYEGIGLVWIFLSAYLWLARERLRWPRALLLLPLGTLAVWSANVVRIVALILLGSHGREELAVGAFHTRIGWVLFCLVALTVVATAERARAFRRAPPPPRIAGRVGHPVAAHVAPLLGILAVQLVGAAFLETAGVVHAASMGTGLLLLFLYRHEYRPFRFSGGAEAVLVGVGVFVIWIALDSGGAGSHEAHAGTGGSLATGAAALGWATWGRGLASTLLVPVAEELAFRGYLIRRLIVPRFQDLPLGSITLYSGLASSLLFGLAHDRWFVGTVAGLAYAFVLYRQRRLSHAILAHGTTNGLLVLWPLLA